MKTHNRIFFILVLFIPCLLIGQIPEGHFLDADKSAKNGYKLKPYKQEQKGIYHYAILSELPFENNCSSELSEKEQTACSEKQLRQLIYSKLSSQIKFKGNIYVYLTVTTDVQLTDITVSSHPNSKTANTLIENAIKNINFKPGKFNDKTVSSRLWTSLTFPSSSNEIFSESLAKMKTAEHPKFQDYENLVFDATQYIFSNPVYAKGKEFNAATQIIGFWSNKDIGMGIPAFGKFYNALTNKNQQQFLYIVAMLNYGLDQKLNHNRLLECKPKKGEKFSEQADVKEVQLEAAKILLEFIGDKNNNVPISSKTKTYYKAFKKGKLDEKFYK